MATVASHVGESSVYGNVVARSSFSTDQQKQLDSGGNVSGYAVVDGHYTYVGAGRTGQAAYNVVYPSKAVTPQPGLPGKDWMGGPGAVAGGGTSTPTAPATDPAKATPDPYTQYLKDRDAVEKALNDRNAIEALGKIFHEYGIDLYDARANPNDSIVNLITRYVKNGYDKDTIGLLIQDSDQWHARFSGNDERRKNGLAVLSPAEYLATERAYKDAAAAYGLPAEFYDQPEDFGKLIGKDISPDEFSKRASYAFRYAQSQDETTRTALQQFYGVDTQHLAAYYLDPEKGQAILDRQAKAAEFGALQLDQGLSADKNRSERWVDLGLSNGQVAAGVSQAAEITPQETSIAKRFGQEYGVGDALDETVTGLASAKRKRELLNSSESALFASEAGSTGKFGLDYSGGY